MRKNFCLGFSLAEKQCGFQALLSYFALEMKLHVLSLIPEGIAFLTPCVSRHSFRSDSVRSKSQMSRAGLFFTLCTCVFKQQRPTQVLTLESRSLCELLHRAVDKQALGHEQSN